MSMKQFKGGVMRKRLTAPVVVLAGFVLIGLSSTVACGKIAGLKAAMTFKEANKAYEVKDYKKAAGLYEQTVANDPSLAMVYFYIGNCYDNMYKPGLKGVPENDALIEKAVQNYEAAADKLGSTNPGDVKLKQLALQYLTAAFAADKLDDPVRAEPVVIRMIQLDPAETSNYFTLAKIYEDAGEYDASEKVLVMAREAKPSDAAVYMQLAGFYNRKGEFTKTIEALQQRAEKEPNNPEAFYMLSTFYWDEAYRNVRLKDEEKRDYIQKGVDAVDKALQIRADYVEAIVYKNLLFRLQANLEKSPDKQKALLKQADELRDKAEALRKQKASGVGD